MRLSRDTPRSIPSLHKDLLEQTQTLSSSFFFFFIGLVSDIPDDATDLIGEGSVHPSQYDDEKFNWLLNLDVDHDTEVYQPATPVSVQSTIPSTPALPAEVEGSEHTASPPRFSPEPIEEFKDKEGTVSDCTYDNIREFFLKLSIDSFDL